ncbi:hypothetical protein FGB62_45g169 [Gracilaria domingensis]|nr:hypothetical protein FGB62_45g169 [Gracilaria domingensis]
MSNEGPSWWCTRTCPGPEPLGKPKTWFVLFEFFKKSSQEYAFLRVSVCDGTMSQDALFNHDEIFSRYGFGRSTQDTHVLSQSFRNVVDQIDPGTLTVLMGSAQFAVVEVTSESLKPAVRLTMKEDLTPNVFVDRITKYMTYVDALIKSAHEDIALRIEQKNELFKAAEKKAKAKQDDDEILTQGMRMIMKEKWDYYRKK